MNDMSEEHKKKEGMAQEVMTTKEERVQSLIFVARQRKIPPRSGGIVLVTLEEKK